MSEPKKRNRKHELLLDDGRRVISAQKLSAKTGYSERHLRNIAREGKLVGAHLIGNVWFFDERAKKALRDKANPLPAKLETETDDYLSEYI